MTLFNFAEIDVNQVGDGVAVHLESGVYPVQIVEVNQTVSKNGRPQIEIKVRVTEGPGAGAIRTNWVGLPTGEDNRVLYVWAGILFSTGLTKEQLAKASLNTEQIVGYLKGAPGNPRTAFIDYTAGDRDMGQYDNVKFITREGYEKKKANPEAFAAPAPRTPPAAAASAAVAPAGIPVVPVAGHNAVIPGAAPAAFPQAPAASAGVPAPSAAVVPSAPATTPGAAGDLLSMFG
jgi:hypothetical protein